ncbi:MAG: hypothetical protein ACI8P3_003397 [Saprospiraceae bacterium]|jgi:hypothetical protein
MKLSNLLTTGICLLVCLNLHAKKGDKVPGYVTLNDGVKMEGKIIIGSITDNETKVVFYNEDNNKKTTYKPKDLEGYGFEEKEIDEIGKTVKRWIHFDRQKVDYPPKMFASTTVFMEREERGIVTLYTYYIEIRDNPKQPYKYYYYILTEDDELEKVEKEDYVNTAKKIFKQYSALNSRIGKKDFEYRNLDRMVRDYNYWTVQQHDPDTYKVAMKE